MSASPIFIGSIKQFGAKLVNADSTTLKTLLAGATNGSRIKALHISSDDTVARIVQLWITISAVDYLLGSFNVPITAGFDGVALPIDGLALAALPALQTDGLKTFLDVANGATLKASVTVAVTAAKTLYFTGEYGDV